MSKTERNIPRSIPLHEQSHLGARGFFYVGGEYTTDGSDLMDGQMYVEVYAPRTLLHPYPLVLMHGACQTGLCWMQTADGRPGWVDFFLGRGYAVYVIDQPARGRSVSHISRNGVRKGLPVGAVERSFTSPADGHTQWPGSGKRGDRIFDAFYATQVEGLFDVREIQEKMRRAGAALLDRIGEVILIGHSQAGPFVWIMANDRPDLVKGMIAIEPSGPPFTSVQTGQPLLDGDGNPTTYGITLVPLDFTPPAASARELRIQAAPAPGAAFASGYLQADPPRQLLRMRGIPSLVLSAEASYHTKYDYWSAAFLSQAGVPTQYVRLSDQRIHGNGHMMMLEKNSDEVAAFLDRWICANTPADHMPPQDV